mmetsp:Transcript_46310/g.110218  ORF Transcript_46310/g.110218 Transcript_46310/m.110218 type:complete len:195 (-) Transcript_46310:20-604(-)
MGPIPRRKPFKTIDGNFAIDWLDDHFESSCNFRASPTARMAVSKAPRVGATHTSSTEPNFSSVLGEDPFKNSSRSRTCCKPVASKRPSLCFSQSKVCPTVMYMKFPLKGLCVEMFMSLLISMDIAAIAEAVTSTCNSSSEDGRTALTPDRIEAARARATKIGGEALMAHPYSFQTTRKPQERGNQFPKNQTTEG